MQEPGQPLEPAAVLPPAEIESALVGHAGVAEAAVIAVTDEMTGQAVVAYVTVASGVDPGRLLRDIADGRELGDVSTLADPSVVAALQQVAEGGER
jgi:acetyl-CoA synthetase